MFDRCQGRSGGALDLSGPAIVKNCTFLRSAGHLLVGNGTFALAHSASRCHADELGGAVRATALLSISGSTFDDCDAWTGLKGRVGAVAWARP